MSKVYPIALCLPVKYSKDHFTGVLSSLTSNLCLLSSAFAQHGGIRLVYFEVAKEPVEIIPSFKNFLQIYSYQTPVTKRLQWG